MGSVMEQHGRTDSQGYSEASESSLRCCLVRWGRSSFVLFFLSPEVLSTPLKQNHQPGPTPPKLATCEHGTEFVCAPPTLLLILQRFPCNRGPNSRCLRSCLTQATAQHGSPTSHTCSGISGKRSSAPGLSHCLRTHPFGGWLCTR